MTNRKRYILPLMAAALLSVALYSCKDDDDDDIQYKSFSGALRFDIPAYVAPGDDYLMTPSGVKRNSSDELTTAPGYYWSIKPSENSNDTTRYENSSDAVTGAKHIIIPDTLCTMTISCVAFASGYQASSATAYPTIVKPTIPRPSLDGGTIIGSITDMKVLFGTWFSDDRDGRWYPAAGFNIGNQWWMGINLCYGGSGRPYADCPAMKDVFGLYYTWEEAQTACPDGWHLPTKGEWATLAQKLSPEGYTDQDSVFKGLAGKMMVDASFNEEKMWPHSADNHIAGSYFNAIPTGYAYKKGADYYFAGAFKYAAYWVKDEYDATHGQYRYIYYDSPDVYLGIADKSSFLASVRCLLDY